MSRHQSAKRRAIWRASALTGALFFLITMFGPALGGFITL